MTRSDVLSEAIDKCMKELYFMAQPTISWEKFLLENKIYKKKIDEWNKLPDDERPDFDEYCGPAPYNFYYLPKDIIKEICDSYVSAYKLDSNEELLNIISILKNYCLEPIINKWIDGHIDEDGFEHPGHSGYDYPDNIQKAIYDIIPDSGFDRTEIVAAVVNKFFEFLDMAGKFFSWNHDLNAFNRYVYLGGSPNSSKERVIENWKKYRNKDIEIDDSIYEDREED